MVARVHQNASVVALTHVNATSASGVRVYAARDSCLERTGEFAMSKLTVETIQRVVGPLDQGRIVEILKTNASENELIEAFEWLYGDDYMAELRHHAPNRIVEQLRDILNRNETARDEEL